MARRPSESPRAHGRAQNTSTITFRFPSGPPAVLLVHGRPALVKQRILAFMRARKHKITFHDLKSDRERTIILTNVDSWSVK